MRHVWPAPAAVALVVALSGWSSQPARAQAAGEEAGELMLVAGKSAVVTSDRRIQRVSVGSGDVAEANAVGLQEVLVNGRAPGETTLIIWQEGGGKQFFDVTVRPSRLAAEQRIGAVRAQLLREVGGNGIDVAVEDGAVFLRGRVPDLSRAERAVSIASTLGKVVNLLYVDVPAVEQQILLKVRFATVDRSAVTELGLNLFSTGALNTLGSTSTQQFPQPRIERDEQGRVITTISDALNIFLFRPDLDLGATIRALQRRALIEVLAEPNVLAINGRQASFLAGGEFPYPVIQGGGIGGTLAITIQFREFGVRLNFLPVITPRGTIRLQVAPEVSALDFNNGLILQGFRIPALTMRKVNTAVELNEGQSFAIAGLMDNRLAQSLQRIPYIGDIPVLGRLFRSRALDRSNTELLVIVTPELVRPIPAGQNLPAVKFPQEFLPANTPGPIAHPNQSITGPVPVTPAKPSVPVESLRESLKPDPPLQEQKNAVPALIVPLLTPATTAGQPVQPAVPANTQ